MVKARERIEKKEVERWLECGLYQESERQAGREQNRVRVRVRVRVRQDSKSTYLFIAK